MRSALMAMVVLVAVGCDGADNGGGSDIGRDDAGTDTVSDGGTGTDTGDNGDAGDPGQGTEDTGAGETWPVRTPVDVAALAGAWEGNTADGVVTLTFGPGNAVSRASTDPRVAPFEGTFEVAEDMVTLRHGTASEQVIETFDAAIVDGRLYDRVLLRVAFAGGETVDGNWEGKFGVRVEIPGDPTLFEETRNGYTLRLTGTEFMNRDEYYEAIPFGDRVQELQEAHVGRGTCSVVDDEVTLTYVEYLNEVTGMTVDPPTPEVVGRRIALDVIDTVGSGDAVFVRVR